MEEYSLFIETARRHIELDRVNGFDNAIKECLENDILKEYLQRKAKEVINMLTVEYDYATDIAVQREEAAKEACKKQKKQKKQRKKLGKKQKKQK